MDVAKSNGCFKISWLLILITIENDIDNHRMCIFFSMHLHIDNRPTPFNCKEQWMSIASENDV